MRQIILDTETTGLSWEKGNRVVEIGCVELVERRPTGRTFQCYLNPEREFEPGAQEVTGLTWDFLADKPKFADVVDEFLAFVDGAELVIHNAAFDIGFLDCGTGAAGAALRTHARALPGRGFAGTGAAALSRASAIHSMRCASAWASTTPTASCMARCSMRNC